MAEPRDEGADASPDAPESATTTRAATRYSFSRFAAESWNHFRAAAATLIGLFAAAHVVAALAPYLIVFEAPTPVGYGLVFLFRVVLPVVLGSIAIAAASVVLMRRLPSHPGDADAPAPRAFPEVTRRWSDVVVLGLLASLMGIIAVLFLGAYGFLILHLFYGPPVAAQSLMIERTSYRDALQRARTLLRGNWRTILYLLNAALAVGALGLLALDVVVRVVGTGAGPVMHGVLAAAQGLVLGTLTAFLAGAQVAIYLYLRQQQEEWADRGSEQAKFS